MVIYPAMSTSSVILAYLKRRNLLIKLRITYSKKNKNAPGVTFLFFQCLQAIFKQQSLYFGYRLTLMDCQKCFKLKGYMLFLIHNSLKFFSFSISAFQKLLSYDVLQIIHIRGACLIQALQTKTNLKSGQVFSYSLLYSFQLHLLFNYVSSTFSSFLLNSPWWRRWMQKRRCEQFFILSASVNITSSFPCNILVSSQFILLLLCSQWTCLVFLCIIYKIQLILTYIIIIKFMILIYKHLVTFPSFHYLYMSF